MVLEKVEAAHFVGAVVRAVTSAKTAVVNHCIESLGVMNGRLDRAHRLARGIFALHAVDGLIVNGWRIWIAFEILVDSDPVHFAAS